MEKKRIDKSLNNAQKNKETTNGSSLEERLAPVLQMYSTQHNKEGYE